MKHNPKPEEKKAAGIDDDFAVKKDFAQSCTLRRIAAAVLYLSILFCCTITALKLPSLAVLFPLAAVLLIPPLCFAFNCFAASKVEFAVKASSSCPRGESCHCEIVLRNDSIVPLPFVRCTLILLNKLNGENRISGHSLQRPCTFGKPNRVFCKIDALRQRFTADPANRAYRLLRTVF